MTSFQSFGGGDPLLTLILFPFVLVFNLVTLPVAWLMGAVLARRSLEKWPRLVAANPGQLQALRVWVTAVPVLGAVSYGTVWCWKRATAPVPELVASRAPFPPRPWESPTVSAPRMPMAQLPPTLPYPVPPAGLRPDIKYIDPPPFGIERTVPGFDDRFSERGSR